MQPDNGISIRVAVHEEKLLTMRGICSVIESAGDMQLIVGTNNRETLMQSVATQLVDVVITGVETAEEDDLSLIKRLRKTSPQTGILIISNELNNSFIFNYFEAGVSGYILAGVSEYQLQMAIRTVYAGQIVIEQGVFQRSISIFKGAKIHNPTGSNDLTKRELEVLALSAKGLSNKLVSQRLSLSERTIHGYFRSIFGKMRVASRTEAIYRAVLNEWIKLS